MSPLTRRVQRTDLLLHTQDPPDVAFDTVMLIKNRKCARGSARPGGGGGGGGGANIATQASTLTAARAWGATVGGSGSPEL